MTSLLLASVLAAPCQPPQAVSQDLGAALHGWLDDRGIDAAAVEIDGPSESHPGVDVEGHGVKTVLGDDTSQLTVGGAYVETRFALGAHENPATGKEHWSFLVGLKAQLGRLKWWYGEEDNYVAVHGGWLSWGLTAGRKVTDRDGDGMPEVETHSRIGPIGVEFTTEMVRELVPEERYHQLAREAADRANSVHGWWPSEDKARFYRQTLSDALEAEAAATVAARDR